MKRDEIETPYGYFQVLPVWLWPLRLGRWARETRRKAICRLRGHRWRAPRRNPLLGDFRTCGRCFAHEHVGPWPEIRVEAGSVTPRFSWREDDSPGAP